MIPLRVALTDPRLLGGTIRWRPKQLEVLGLFARDDLRTVLVAAGRQGGKSSMAIATAIWGATMRPDLDALVPRGTERHCLIASPTEDQSRRLIRMAAAMIAESPVLARVADVRADRIVFSLESGATTVLEALPANPRSVRGFTASTVLVDEAAHLDSQDMGVANDARMLEALEGSMSLFDGKGLAKLILISTPRGEQGRFYELFREAEAGELPQAAAIQATAWELNPDLDSEEWRESKRRLLGVDGFEQEHAARFVAGGGAFFDLREVDWADGPARPEDAPAWVAALDPAFHLDAFGVALVGESHERGVIVVGQVAGIRPGGRERSLERRRAREDRTLEKVWAMLEPYAPQTVVSDQHQADAIRTFFGRRGCSVRIENLTGPSQTAMFVSTRTRLVDGSLRLWRHAQLLEELRRVRARDASEAILLPRFAGSHADIASALTLGVWQFRHLSDQPPVRVSMPSARPVTAGMISESEVGATEQRRPNGPVDPDHRRRGPAASRGALGGLMGRPF